MASTSANNSSKHSLRLLLPLMGLLGTLAMVILACGGSSANAGTSVGSSGSAKSTATSPAKHFKVGEQVKIGSTFIVTVNSFKTNPGGEFEAPKAGDIYVVVDLSIKNVSSSEQDISTILQCGLKDVTGQKYDETIISGATAPDGKLEADDTVKGQVVYEVPTSQHNFTFSFEADVFAGGQTVWDLHV